MKTTTLYAVEFKLASVPAELAVELAGVITNVLKAYVARNANG